LLSYQQIATFFQFGGLEWSVLKTGKTAVEGLILLDILQGADQAVL